MSTKTKPEIQVDIRTTGIESAVVCAPFDVALEALTGEGYEIISLPQNAQLRIQQGKDAYISRNGNWTREGILYIPGEKPKLVRNSPILESATHATEADRNVKEFYPTREQIESALTNSVDFPTKTIEIPTDRFDSDALAVFAFGGEADAKAYGEFLRNAGIGKMSVYAVDKDYVNKQNQPFVRQMGFADLGNLGFGDLCNWSGLSGDGSYLGDLGRWRVVKF